jgi:hypothetical protein
MLDIWVLKTKEKLTRHKSFIPEEVVRCEVWTRALQIKHNYIWQSPRIKMQLTIHPNEWVQYTS